MRLSVLAVITLLSAPACSRDPASAPAASDGPDKASAPALQIPSVPQISKWELDPENSSAAFVCKHVFSNVRGMFQQPSGTLILDDASPANSKVNATIKVRRPAAHLTPPPAAQSRRLPRYCPRRNRPIHTV